MGKFREIANEEMCPCQSGKRYKECCKKKRFKFGLQDGEIVKRVPFPKDIEPILKEVQAKFLEYYGRMPASDEFFFQFVPIYNDELLLQAVYLFHELDFPENKIYAYYKSDGLLLCSTNIDLLPEKELEEFEKLCKEYDELICASPKNTMNTVQYVLFANNYIEEQVKYATDAIIACLNDFIRRHNESLSIQEYSMKSEIDYFNFSALKTIKTLRSIMKLREDHLPECIYALSRGIFENYMYICSINANPSFFEKKILPKIDEENYTFDTYDDGRINYNRVIDNKTGNKSSVKILISELKENLLYDADEDLYNIFYQMACQYVHVDVMSAKSYFAIVDPYNEIDPSLIACLVATILATLLSSQITQNKNVQSQLRKDVSYLCNNLKEKFTACLDIANSDSEHKNVIYDKLLKRLKEQAFDS